MLVRGEGRALHWTELECDVLYSLGSKHPGSSFCRGPSSCRFLSHSVLLLLGIHHLRLRRGHGLRCGGSFEWARCLRHAPVHLDQL